MHRLVARGHGAEVDALDEPERGEQLQHAVDARDADLAAAALPQQVEDVLRAETAVLLGEHLDHRGARAAGAVALGAQPLDRVLQPRLLGDGHGETITRLKMRARTRIALNCMVRSSR